MNWTHWYGFSLRFCFGFYFIVIFWPWWIALFYIYVSICILPIITKDHKATYKKKSQFFPLLKSSLSLGKTWWAQCNAIFSLRCSRYLSCGSSGRFQWHKRNVCMPLDKLEILVVFWLAVKCHQACFLEILLIPELLGCEITASINTISGHF